MCLWLAWEICHVNFSIVFVYCNTTTTTNNNNNNNTITTDILKQINGVSY